MTLAKRMLAIWLLSIIVAIALALATYHYASPMVVLTNESLIHYDELLVQLPSGRVSIGPISPGASELIYFSPQALGGEVHYSLLSHGNEQAHGTLQYVPDGQLFRVIRIIIRKDGTVEASLSG